MQVASIWYVPSRGAAGNVINRFERFRLFETAHTICCVKFIYSYVIMGFGDYDALLEIDSYVILLPDTCSV